MNSLNFHSLAANLDIHRVRLNQIGEEEVNTEELESAINTDLDQAIKLRDHANELISILSEDILEKNSKPLIQTLVNCLSVYKKLNYISTHLTEIPNSFTSLLGKIKTVSANLFATIQQLEENLAFYFFLPVTYGETLQKVENSLLKRLNFEDPRSLFYVQKLVYHFLADEADKDIIEKLENDKWKGFYSVYSFLSLLQIFETLDHKLEEKNVDLTAAIQSFKKVKPIILKLFIIADFMAMQKKQGRSVLGTGYYRWISETDFSTLSLQHLDHFSPKARVPVNSILCRVPIKVLIQNLSLDIIELISALKMGERILLPLGTVGHSIAMEIIRMGEDSFSCKIFNTGKEVETYHEIENNYAKPIFIMDLPLTAFSESFISGLIDFLGNEDKNDISKWYTFIHKNLIVEDRGIWDLDSGNSYQIQLYGTCSYKSLEAALTSFFSRDLFNTVMVEKVLFSVAKQQAADSHLRNQRAINLIIHQDENDENERPIKKQKKADSSTQKEIEQSSLLLSMSHRQLFKAQTPP